MKDKPMLIMRYGRAIAAMALVALLTPALPACEQYEYMPTMEPERDEDTFRIGILDPIYDLRPNGYPPLHFVSLVFDPINSFQFSNPNVQFEKPNISLVKMEVSDGVTLSHTEGTGYSYSGASAQRPFQSWI